MREGQETADLPAVKIGIENQETQRWPMPMQETSEEQTLLSLIEALSRPSESVSPTKETSGGQTLLSLMGALSSPLESVPSPLEDKSDLAQGSTADLPAVKREIEDQETQPCPVPTGETLKEQLPLVEIENQETQLCPIPVGETLEEQLPLVETQHEVSESSLLSLVPLLSIETEQTSLPLGYTPEIAQKKTDVFPAQKRRKTRRKRKRKREKGIPIKLACVAGLVIAMLVSVSVLSVNAYQRYVLTNEPSHSKPIVQKPPTVLPTPTPTFSPTPTPTPQPQPVNPFPNTLAAEIATLQAHDRFFYNGNTTLPEVALTFDDGPSPAYTPQILAILQQYHVDATFFDVGRLVQAYPELARQELKQGNLVENHTWSHGDLPTLTPDAIRSQIQQTSDEIQQVTGVRPTFMRPPYGDTSVRVLTVINSLALTTVIWNDEAKDWSLPGTSVIVARILNLARNGAIILLHDGGGTRAQTVAALPSIIEQLHARGYTFVTMDQMVAHIHENQDNGTPTPTPTPNKRPKPSREDVLIGDLSCLKHWTT
jgi:peptidoglycan-N-acetylglucosamine deacetylase